MSKIFIAYRRQDTAAYVGRLYDELHARFGDEVFCDIDTIRPGSEYAEVIERAVAEADAMLVVIGRKWLSASSSGGRRLDDPDDHMRVEIESALAHGIFVVPVLVEGAVMPSATDLPESLRPLTRRNALRLTDAGWASEVALLVEVLEEVVPSSATPPARRRRARRRRRLHLAKRSRRRHSAP